MSKDMLDISIKNMDKVITPAKKDDFIADFFDQHFIVEEKFDGIKVNIFRNQEDWTGDYRDCFVVAYKNEIIKSSEFDHVDRDEVKQTSSSIAQFALVHEVLVKAGENLSKIPKNTEIFVEFIMNKDTTTRDYTNKHDLFIIATSPAIAKQSNDRIFTKAEGFFQDKNKQYADLLGIKTTPVIFDGNLGSINEIHEGIKTKELLVSFEKIKKDLTFTDMRETYEAIKKMFQNYESVLGGVPEGAVLKTDDNNYYKFLANDQHDKEARLAQKSKFRGSREEETEYWGKIKEVVIKIIEKLNPEDSFHDQLKSAGKLIYKNEFDIIHPKKVAFQTKEDIYLTLKRVVSNNLPENNNCLVIGKFRVFSTKHAELIQKGLTEFNEVVVAIVSGKDAIVPKKTREAMIRDVFPNEDEVEICHVNTGNILTILNKAKHKIKAVYAGSDRVEAYKNMLAKYDTGVKIVELKRDMDSDDNVSATRIYDAISKGDEETFKQLVPPQIHHMFNDLKPYAPPQEIKDAFVLESFQSKMKSLFS